MIKLVVEHPEKSHFFMPPFCGTPQEAELLGKYMASIAPAHPRGMNYGNER
jgi:hypothetical protein